MLRDLSARDAHTAFGVLNAQTQFQYASISADELACYLYYRDIMFEVGKADNWAQMSRDEQDDFVPNDVKLFLSDLVRREPSASMLLPGLDIAFVLQGMPSEPGPLLGWEGLEPGILEVFRALASKLPLALGSSLAPVLAQLRVKKEEKQEKQEPAPEIRELDQQSCLDIERQLLQPYVAEQVRPCMLLNSVPYTQTISPRETLMCLQPGKTRRAHVMGNAAPQPRTGCKGATGRFLG